MDKETLVRIGTLGGKIRIDRNKLWLYGNNAGLKKEKLYGISGPLHPGMKRNMEVALEANQSDTRQTLVRELTDQSHMTRREAEETVKNLIEIGVLEEINDPTLGKVIVFKNRSRG